MARVLSYERPVDAVLINTKVQEGHNCTPSGFKIKQEPCEQDTDRLVEPVLSDNNGDAAIQAEPTGEIPEDQVLSNRINNKENEYLLTMDNANTGNERPIITSRRKRKRRGRNRRRHRTNRGRKRKRNRTDTFKDSVEERLQENGDAVPLEQSQLTEKSERGKTLRSSEHKRAPSVKCEVCFLRFRCESSLKWYHARNERPQQFSCEKCQMRFNCCSKLIRHEKVCAQYSTDYWKAECHFCQQKFRSKMLVQTHLFHSHGDLIYSSESTDSRQVELVETESCKSTEKQLTPVPTTPVKKMRQTILTDFVQFFKNQKEEPVSPPKANPAKTSSPVAASFPIPTASTSPVPVAASPRAPTAPSLPVRVGAPPDVPVAAPCTSAMTPTSSKDKQTNKPFVHIHAKPELLMSLLSSRTCTIKNEPPEEDHWTPDTPQSTPYGLRKGRHNQTATANEPASDFRRKRLRHSQHSECSTPKRQCNADPQLSNSQLKRKFECKEFTIPLVRCDFIQIKTEKTHRKHERTRIWDTVKDRDQHDDAKLKDLGVSVLKLSFDGSMSSKSEPSPETIAKPKSEKPFPCKYCSKTFSSKENVREHTSLFHVAYMSSICNARYKTRNQLTYHYLRAHGSYKRNECCVCEQPFTSQFKLKRHLFGHCIKIARSSKETYPVSSMAKCNAFKKSNKCTLCGKKFWLSSCLKQHEKLYHSWARTTQNEKEGTEKETHPITTNKLSSTTANTKSASNGDDLMKSKAPHPKGVTYLSIPWRENSDGDETSPETMEKTTEPSSNALTSAASGGKETTDRKCSVTKTSSRLSDNAVIPSKQLASGRVWKVPNENQMSRIIDEKITRTSTASTPNVRTAPEEQPSGNDANGVTTPVGSRVDVMGSSSDRHLCTICGVSFLRSKNLVRHHRENSRPNRYQCELCGMGFPTKEFLASHTENAHNPETAKNLKGCCRVCKVKFCKKRTLHTHEAHTHPELILLQATDESYKHTRTTNVCNVCNLMFETYDRFIEHNMYYYKGLVFTCTFCGEHCQGMYMLHHHNKIMHYPEEVRKTYTYICDTCNEGFKQETHFHAHKLHVHLNEGSLNLSSSAHEVQFSLMKCSPTLSKTAVVDDKQLAVTTYCCEVCQMSFPNARDLMKHNMEFAVVGDFQCNKCDRKCPNPIILKMHQILSHSDSDIDSKYKCRFCAEVLTTRAAMTCHEKHFHHNNSSGVNEHLLKDKPNAIQQQKLPALQAANKDTAPDKQHANETVVLDNLRCFTCGMHFTNEAELRDHYLAYSDIGDHVCNICHRRFVEAHRLEEHRFKHLRLSTILYDHHCPICYEGFTSVTLVRTHLLHLHGYDTFQNIISRRKNHLTTTKPHSMQLEQKDGKHLTTDAVDTPTPNKKVTERVAAASAAISNESVSNDVGINEPGSTSVAALPELSTTPGTSRNSMRESVENGIPIKCDVCGLKFAAKKNLTKHKMRYINKGNHVCRICGRRFPWESIYQEHHNKHIYHDDMRNFKYICPYCGERFRSLSLAHSHVIHLHATSKPDSNSEDAKINGSQGPQPIIEDVCAAKMKTQSPSKIKDHGWPKTSSPELNRSQNCPEFDISSGFEKYSLNMDDENAVGVLEETYHQQNAQGNADSLPELTGGPDLMDEATIIVEQDKAFPTSQNDSITYNCPVCLMEFSQLTSFQVHFRFNHSTSMKQAKALQWPFDPNTIECIICGTSFISEPDFKEHLDQTHMPRLAPEPIVEIIEGEKEDNCDGAVIEESIVTSKPVIASTENPTSVNDATDDLEVIWEKNVAVRKQNGVRMSKEDADECQEIINLDIVEENENCDDVVIEESIVTSKPVSVIKNANLGKLKVRPFAKIIEDLTQNNGCPTSSDITLQSILSSSVSLPTANTANLSQL